MLSPIRLTCLICVWSLIFVLSSAIGQPTDPEEDPRLPLAMEVFLKQPGKHVYDLHVHLTNVSPDPVTVDVRDLPWNPTDDNTWLSVVRLDAPKTPIHQDYPLGRFGSCRVRLVPGESIQGTIPLNPRIPSLLQEIEQFDVQLEWDCPPSFLKFVCKTNSQRTVTIPKDDPGQPDVYSIDTHACLTLEQRIGLIHIPHDHEVLFLLINESVITEMTRVQSLLLQVDDYVQRCHPMWTNSWAVSFVTDKMFAGFLSDGENPRYFEQGLWQQANIGQYSSQILTLFRFPWIKRKADAVYLSIYQLQQQGKASSAG